jgi:SpoVK/Ycf46/Vps4 family AAA+-type ATPase
VIEALLRPGRFEVQVEVPPPRSLDQRVSILKVHTQNMHAAGRLLVNDPPAGTAASQHIQVRKPLLYRPWIETT